MIRDNYKRYRSYGHSKFTSALLAVDIVVLLCLAAAAGALIAIFTR